MDDRYLYYAVSDADFFEVPWAGLEDDELLAPDDTTWSRAVAGP